MSVTKEITRLEKSSVKLSLTVPKEDVQSQYQDLLKDYCKNVQLPGFRKGHVPQEVLERKYGDSLKGEAMGKIIDTAVGDVLGDEGLPKDQRPLPYSQPRLEGDPKLDFGEDLHFSVVYDVFPAVNIGRWKGLEVEVPGAAVTDGDIARELEELRQRNAFVLDRDENAEAQNGDVVTVNYCELDDNDEALPNSKRDDFTFTLGSGQNAYHFDTDIIGMKKGETLVFTKTYPKDDARTAFAGTTKKLELTLTALKEKKLPDLDDDLAQDVDEKYNTLDDLKKSIRERLEKALEQRLREVKINKLLEKIMENTPVELPESMVKVELDGRIRNLARQFGTDTEKVLEMLAHSGDGLDDIETKWRPAAEKALHSRLIVDTLMEQEHIDASNEDIEQELETVAADSGDSVDDLKGRYGEAAIRELLKDNIRERRFFDMLLSENTIKTGQTANYLDVMANNG